MGNPGPATGNDGGELFPIFVLAPNKSYRRQDLIYSTKQPPCRPRPGSPPTKPSHSSGLKKELELSKSQILFSQSRGKRYGFPGDKSILDPKEAFVKCFSFLKTVHSKEFVYIEKPLVRTELYPLDGQSQRKLARELVLTLADLRLG